jgi:hypothetical protein
MNTYTIVGGGGGCQQPPPAHTTQLQGDLPAPLTHNNSTRVHKITNVPLFKKLWDIIFFLDNHFMSHFKGHFEGVKKVLAPSKCPLKWLIKWFSRKKNYVPQFLKQQYINYSTVFYSFKLVRFRNKRAQLWKISSLGLVAPCTLFIYLTFTASRRATVWATPHPKPRRSPWATPHPKPRSTITALVHFPAFVPS